MAKGKKSTSSNRGANGRHNHGPKTHIHHAIQHKAIRYEIGKGGMLSKYDDYESWFLACSARGNHRVSHQEFEQFVVLPLEQKRAYFANMKHKSPKQ